MRGIALRTLTTAIFTGALFAAMHFLSFEAAVFLGISVTLAEVLAGDL